MKNYYLTYSYKPANIARQETYVVSVTGASSLFADASHLRRKEEVPMKNVKKNGRYLGSLLG